jgi:type III secretion protein C
MKTQDRLTTIHRAAAVALVTALVIGAGIADAAPTPRANRALNLNVQDQRLSAFLNELLGAEGFSTVMSPAVDGLVNGKFSGSLDAILGEISRRHYVTFYRIDRVIYVYGDAEVTARTLASNPALAQRLTQQVRDQRMADDKNFLARSDNGTVVAVGTPRFHERLAELVRASDWPAQPTVRRAAPNLAKRPAKPKPTPIAATLAAKPQATDSTAVVAAPEPQRTSDSMPTLTPPLLTPPLPSPAATVAGTSANGAVAVSESSGAGAAPSTTSAAPPALAAPLRPRFVWRSAYARPEPVQANEAIASPAAATATTAIAATTTTIPADPATAKVTPRFVWRSAYAKPPAD